MKIIHVAGASGTGKTLFIRELVPALRAIGPTGVVKHIGHHLYRLEPEKDTTLFFESGAQMSAGLDSEKTVVIIREPDLDPILTLFADSGIRYAVIEGFKQMPFNKIVFGDLPGAENVLMIEPSVGEVLSRLEEFSELFTPCEMLNSLRSACPSGDPAVVCTFPAYPGISSETVTGTREELVPGGGRAVITVRQCGTDRPSEYHLGVCAPDARTALRVALTEIEKMLPKNQGDGS